MNITRQKKGQLQMAETISIIIIVLIIIIFAIVFWGKVKYGDVKQQEIEIKELSVIEISKLLNEMTELNCYQAGVEEVECIDWYKVLAFNATMYSGQGGARDEATFSYYRKYFSASKITIERIYPEHMKATVVIYNHNITNTSSRQLYMPVLIKDSVRNSYGFGVVIVEGYITLN